MYLAKVRELKRMINKDSHLFFRLMFGCKLHNKMSPNVNFELLFRLRIEVGFF